ncbi:MAG: hypothetical protein IJ366_10435 [Clostridia bacterium]|nr:hypothetical protein [Clostridia bacterium]
MKKNKISKRKIKYCIRSEDMKVDCISDDDINSALIRCIKSKGMSMAYFSKISGIAESTMVRYNKKLAEPTLEIIVLSCIALRTNVFQALYLISIAGYNIFYSEDKKIYLLLIMLSWYFGISVDEANDILIGLNMKPLTKIRQKQK